MKRQEIRDFVLRSARARIGRILSREHRGTVALASKTQRKAMLEDVTQAHEGRVRFDADGWWGRRLSAGEVSEVSRELARMEAEGLITRYDRTWSAELTHVGWIELEPVADGR